MQAVLNTSDYPSHRTHFVQGRVEDTLRRSEALPDKIAILRLDTDFYSSTAVELEVLWPRLQPGGWLYIDDYFDFGGARQAVDEWLQRYNWRQKAWDVAAFDKRNRVFHTIKARAPTSGSYSVSRPAQPFERAYFS